MPFDGCLNRLRLPWLRYGVTSINLRDFIISSLSISEKNYENCNCTLPRLVSTGHKMVYFRRLTPHNKKTTHRKVLKLGMRRRKTNLKTLMKLIDKLFEPLLNYLKNSFPAIIE